MKHCIKDLWYQTRQVAEISGKQNMLNRILQVMEWPCLVDIFDFLAGISTRITSPTFIRGRWHG